MRNMPSTVFERLGFRRSPTEEALAASLNALGAGQQRMLEELQALRESVSTLTRREVQLRAVLRRNAELAGALPGLEQTIANPDIEAHIRRAFASATLRMDPFPHAVIDDLLPQDLYDALLEGLPPE